MAKRKKPITPVNISKDKTRVGIVLEGGGAKGAYALGCLCAIKELGIEIDTVAGTSVGAINAMLYSTGQLDYGKKFWQSLSFSKIVKTRVTKIPFWVLLPFHFLMMSLKEIMPFAWKRPPFTLIILVFLTTLVPVGLVYGFYELSGIFDKQLIKFLGGKQEYIELIDHIDARFWPMIKGLLIFDVASVLIVLVPSILRTTRFSLFTEKPLEEEIIRNLEKAHFSVPTYAVIAHRREVFDPDKPGFIYMMGRTIPDEEEHFVPYYARLDKLPKEDCAQILLASSAIPFGVFPSIHFDFTEYVDGGVADNLPVYPLVNAEHCTDLIIIRLRPHKKGDCELAWQKVDREFRLANIAVKKTKEMYQRHMRSLKKDPEEYECFDPPVNIKHKKCRSWPQRIYVIAPRKSLGGFIRGTMNFNSNYANKLIDLGYKDALRVMKNLQNYTE